MDRLWIKLTGAFAAIIVVGVTVTVVLARQGTATQFYHFMVGNQMMRPASLQQTLADYYATHGSWQGVDATLDRLVRSASGGGMMGGMMGNMMGMFDSHIRLVDDRGVVVADAGNGRGGALPASAVEQGWPIVVDGQRVGTLVIEGTAMTLSGVDEGSLLSGVTRAVLIAGLVAGFVALVLAVLLVHQITRPLAALNRASQQITAGDLDVRVPVQSRDELGQLARTFNRMAAALETQEVLRRNLMADIAHELRTPLSGIQGTVEALQDGVFPPSAENLESIHEQVTLINRLVEDLRTLAQAEAGQLSLHCQSLDMADLVARYVTAQRSRAQQAGIDLQLHVQGVLPPVQGDEERIGQVLGNLLTNALRHTPSGGSIQIRLSSTAEGVRIGVLDSGEGIPSQDLPHIFDRFYRSDRSRSRTTGGSGLGLAIARQLVEAHGGRIWAESPPPGQERGSGFYFVLPAASAL